MVEEEIRKEQVLTKTNEEEASLNDVNTDDENDEVEYEMWKLRELKRNKRDKEEREQYVDNVFRLFIAMWDSVARENIDRVAITT